MNNTTLTKKSPIKLFASFDRNIFIPLVAPNNTPEIIHQRLKAMGARIGRDSIEALIEGTVDRVKDFQVVSVQGTQNTQPEEQYDQIEPQARSIMHVPTTHTLPANTIVSTPSSSVGHVTKTTQIIPTQRTSLRRGKARSLGYLPTKTLQPIRRGAVYAKLMEMVARPEGATVEEMVQMTGNKSLGGVHNLFVEPTQREGIWH